MDGRLLLGLKGQLAEVELNTIRIRMTAGLLNKAQRGDLKMQLPVGLKHDLYGHVQKDPNLEVQNFIHLVFSTFLKLKSAYRTLRYITEHHLQIPRYDRFGELYWKKPTAPAITALLKNPAYAGAFAMVVPK